MGDVLLPEAGREVADTNGADKPLVPGLFKRPPCSPHIIIGLMQKIEVQVVQAKLCKGCTDAKASLLIPVVLDPELAGHKELLSLDAAVLYGAANLGLIVVGCSSVDMPVAGIKGHAHCPVGSAVCRHLKDTTAQSRDAVAIVESVCLHGDLLSCHRGRIQDLAGQGKLGQQGVYAFFKKSI